MLKGLDGIIGPTIVGGFMKHRITLSLLILMCAVLPSYGDWMDDVGYTSLQSRLGGGTPTGAGIDVTQVEAGDGNNNYAPDVNHSEFASKTINIKSGSSGVSSHATTVGRYYYGTSLGFGSGINPIDVYEANAWLNNGFLRLRTRFLPLTEDRRVQNHSWIGSYGNDTYDIDVLRRLDYVINRDGVVVAVGVNNGSGTEMPKLLSSAYNVLAVGLTNGNSSRGPTQIDESGRVKPDIVVPLNLTSWASPVVASSGALLLETADADTGMDYMTNTAKALLVKAQLMAGATKDEFSNWRKGFATPSTDGSVPLDYRYGAGELNIDNSHLILTGQEQDAGGSSDVNIIGWDFGDADSGTSRQYFFEIPPFNYIQDISILVTWNRTFTVSGVNPKVFTPSFANIDLRLNQADGYSVGTLINESVSTLDNVEHIYLQQMINGRYVFEITTDADWDYAVAWKVVLAPTVATDFDGDSDVDSDDFDYFQSCSTGPAVGPPSPGCENADLDGDNDVDQSDFGLFQRCISGAEVLADQNCYP